MSSLLSPLVRLLGSSSATGSTNRSEPWITNEESSTESTSFGHTLSAPGKTTSLPSIASLPETKRLVVTQALNDLFTKGHFSICGLNSILEVMGNPYRGEAYTLLRTLHCVDYNKMPADLRNRIPQLVNECLRPPEPTACLATEVALQGVEI